MKKYVVICLSVLVLCGCVSTKNVALKKDAAENLKGKDVTLTSRDKPLFSAVTPGKAMFGMVGAIAMAEAGKKIVTDNHVEDPAIYIGNALLPELASLYGARTQESRDLVVTNEKAARLAALYSKFPYILDVKTVNWSFTYFPADWNTYRVIYSAKLRLIDTQSKKVISEGFCKRVPEKSEESPSQDELLQDNAARLKLELKAAADHCINEFRAVLLNT